MALYRYTWRTFSRELTFLFAAALFFAPIYIFVVLMLKSTQEVYSPTPLSFPDHVETSNFSTAWEVGMGRAMLNSLIITIGSVTVLLLLGSLCAYALSRTPGKLSSGLYGLFLVGIVLPANLGLVPTYVAMKNLGLTHTYLGMIVFYSGLLVPLSVFMYTGFLRTLPREYEESARVDGASVLRTFFRVVFPLMRPITATVAILIGLVTWNDFFHPLIFLNGTNNEPLPLAIYSVAAKYTSQWNLLFAALAISMLPMLIFFFVAQRRLVETLAGGVRG